MKGNRLHAITWIFRNICCDFICISIFKYEIALWKEIVFANEVHGNAYKCENNNKKMSAIANSQVITIHPQLCRTLISRLYLAILKIYSQIVYLVKKDFTSGRWNATVSEGRKNGFSHDVHPRVRVCFSFSSSTFVFLFSWRRCERDLPHYLALERRRISQAPPGRWPRAANGPDQDSV